MTFVKRLRERKLVRWGLAYLAGAWIVLQVMDVLGEQWGWSLGLQRGGSAALAVGLLVALVLAWYHGEKGHQSVSGTEAAVLVVLVVLGAGLVWTVGRGESGARTVSALDEPGGVPALAALPFVNRSGAAEDAYFTDGVRDEILTRLTKLSGIRVVSRTSVLAYRDSPRPLPEIAAELGARYVLEGGLLRAGEQVRIDVKLFEGPSDSQVWAENYDRPLSLDNLLEIQSEIAGQVAAALDATISPSERVDLEAPTASDLTALDLYYLARSHWKNRDQESLSLAIDLFRRAIEIDSTFAAAHAGLADALAVESYHYRPLEEDRWGEAESAARRAIELDPGLAEAWTSLGFTLMYGRWDWPGADEAFRTATRLDPEYPVARYWYCELLMATLDERAEEECTAAVRVDRRSAVAHVVLGHLYWAQGRLEEAVVTTGEARRFAPDFTAAYDNAGWVYAELGDREGFAEVFGRSSLAGQDEDRVWSAMALGDTSAIFDAARSGDPADSGIAVLYAAGGMADSAVAVLSRALHERDDVALLLHPVIRRMVDEPARFVEIDRRLGIRAR